MESSRNQKYPRSLYEFLDEPIERRKVPSGLELYGAEISDLFKDFTVISQGDSKQKKIMEKIVEKFREIILHSTKYKHNGISKLYILIMEMNQLGTQFLITYEEKNT